MVLVDVGLAAGRLPFDRPARGDDLVWPVVGVWTGAVVVVVGGGVGGATVIGKGPAAAGFLPAPPPTVTRRVYRAALDTRRDGRVTTIELPGCSETVRDDDSGAPLAAGRRLAPTSTPIWATVPRLPTTTDTPSLDVGGTVADVWGVGGAGQPPRAERPSGG